MADVPAEVHIGDRDAAVLVDARVRFALERILCAISTDGSYGIVNPAFQDGIIAKTYLFH